MPTVCWKTRPPSIANMLSIKNSNMLKISVSVNFLVESERILTAQLVDTSFRYVVPRSGYYVLFLYPGVICGYNRSKTLRYNVNRITYFHKYSTNISVHSFILKCTPKTDRGRRVGRIVDIGLNPVTYLQ